MPTPTPAPTPGMNSPIQPVPLQGTEVALFWAMTLGWTLSAFCPQRWEASLRIFPQHIFLEHVLCASHGQGKWEAQGWKRSFLYPWGAHHSTADGAWTVLKPPDTLPGEGDKAQRLGEKAASPPRQAGFLGEWPVGRPPPLGCVYLCPRRSRSRNLASIPTHISSTSSCFTACIALI